MIFKPEQIQEILKTVDMNTKFLAAKVLGSDILTKEDKKDLKKWGFNLKEIEQEFPSFVQSYHFGRLSSLIGDVNSRKITYSEFTEYLRRGQYLPLSEVEKYSLNVAKQRTYGHITGLGEGMKNNISQVIRQTEQERRADYEKVIKKELEKGVADRKSLKGIVSDLGHKTGDWSRNFSRIVSTEMNNVFQQGRSDMYKERYGEDVRVYKDVYPGACFPIDDTEYLTSEGFKKLDEIKGCEKVFSFNLKTNYGEWSNIKSIIRYKYEGDMHLYKNSQIDLMSTPNHYHLIGKRIRWVKKDTYNNVLMQSQDMRNLVLRDIMYKGVNGWKGNSNKFITVAGKTFKTEYFAKFMGWWLAEGHVTFRRKRKDGSSNMSQIAISQSKEYNFEEIDHTFKNMFYDRSVLRINERFVCNLDRSYDDLVKWFLDFGKAIDKFIPIEVLDLDKKYLLMFLESFTKGDGLKSKGVLGKKGKIIDDRSMLFTSSKKLADNLIEVVLKCGYSPGLSVRDCVGTVSYKKDGSRVETKHLQYIIRLNKNKYVKNINKYFSVINNWSGEVGCLELNKNYTLFIRRNNKHVWTGNCRHCIEKYTTKGLGSKPRVFRLSELEANGSNIGKKVADWLPTLPGMHPYCRCTLRSILPGQVWDEESESFKFKADKKLTEKYKDFPKIKVSVGSKKFEV